jgi:hypothetical protein
MPLIISEASKGIQDDVDRIDPKNVSDKRCVCETLRRMLCFGLAVIRGPMVGILETLV